MNKQMYMHMGGQCYHGGYQVEYSLLPCLHLLPGSFLLSDSGLRCWNWAARRMEGGVTAERCPAGCRGEGGVTGSCHAAGN